MLQYCKFVGETVLYATENDWQTPVEQREIGVDENGDQSGGGQGRRGWYDHGEGIHLYLTCCFLEEGHLLGTRYVDLCKSPKSRSIS